VRPLFQGTLPLLAAEILALENLVWVKPPEAVGCGVSSSSVVLGLEDVAVVVVVRMVSSVVLDVDDDGLEVGEDFVVVSCIDLSSDGRSTSSSSSNGGVDDDDDDNNGSKVALRVAVATLVISSTLDDNPSRVVYVVD